MNAAPFKLIYVDDDENDRYLLGRAAASLGDQVQLTMFSDGADAIAHLRQIESPADVPNLLLSDLKMPRVSGCELTKWIRASKMHCIPVIVISSTQLPDDVLQCYRAGANSFVCKPVDHGELRKFIETMVTFWHRYSITPARFDVPAHSTCELHQKAA